MADKQVFLSYSLDDLETARHLVQAIEARGWAISWERYDEPDAIASLALRESLSASDCVVVLWSTHSVNSPAIREEASSARHRGALVQATLDDSAVPMPFVLDEPTRLTDEWSVNTVVHKIAGVLDAEVETLSRESQERAPDDVRSEARLEARVLDVAEEHAEAGELDQAIAIFERWVEEKRDDMKAVRRLGDLYLSAERPADAAAQYERVAEHYAASGFLVPAIETYKRIVELVRDNETYTQRLAELTEEKALQTTGTQRAMASVQFTLTAPPYVAAGERFNLDVWAHRDEDRVRIAERLDGPNVSSAPIASVGGPVLTARAHIDGLEVETAEARLEWDKGIGVGTFPISSTRESIAGARSGVVGIYFLGLQIARIHFLVQLGETTSAREMIPSRQERHAHAVACCAADDRAAVEARIRSFEKAAPGVRVSLESVDVRGRDDAVATFLDQISGGDVLYLFWSQHAAQSKDVEREWRYALRLRGIDFIDPVPLVSPDIAPPPPELATLHDGDWEPVPELPERATTITVEPSTP